MNFSKFAGKKSVRILVITALAVLLLATVVFAQTTNVWDPDPVPDPTWDAATQSWVTSGSITFVQPYQNVCIAYGDDNNNLETALECTLDTSVTPNPFICSIPGTNPGVANRTAPLYWMVYATDASLGPCFSSQGYEDIGGDGYVAPNGTGPNAVTLQSFSTSSAPSSTIWLGVALLAGVGILGGAYVLRRRSQQ